MAWWRNLVGCAAAAALAGCSATGASAPPASAAAAAAALSQDTAPAAPETVDPSMLGGVLAGSVGLGL
jgi:hypothetical protein